MGMEVVLDSLARPNRTPLGPLVTAARSGDRDAFRALVEPHLGVAIASATLLTGSASDAADVVQDALLSAWQGLDGLREPDAFPAWFRTHVVRSASRRVRSRGRLVELDAAAPLSTDELDRALEGRNLGRAFGRLDDADRLLLTLHHVWGLPIAETAIHLGIPEGTVKSRVHYAMDRLRAAYDAEDRR
jgi:RNA polymerase sigma factor (sigma-70 family)